MKTRAFGSGRPVSLFSLGTMRALNSAAQMAEVLDAAAAAGINHLETARPTDLRNVFWERLFARTAAQGLTTG